jgi:hypothetical protein
VFNGKIFHSNLTILENLNKSYGFGDFFFKKLEQRLELSLSIKLKDMSQKN